MGQSKATVRGHHVAPAMLSPTGVRHSRVLLQRRSNIPCDVDALFNLPTERCGMQIAAHSAEASARRGFRWQAEEVA